MLNLNLLKLIAEAYDLPLPEPQDFVDEYFIDFLGPNLTAFFSALAGVTILKLLIFRR